MLLKVVSTKPAEGVGFGGHKKSGIPVQHLTPVGGIETREQCGHNKPVS